METDKKTIDLRQWRGSDVGYNIIRFPDGEVQVEFLNEIRHKDSYVVVTRIANAEELFILMQVADILNRHGVEWSLHITYLIGMRMDRVMDFNRPYSLQVVANTIKGLGYREVYVETPHSNKTLNLLGATSNNQADKYHKIVFDEFNCGVVCFPDMGARERYGDLIHSRKKIDRIYFEKERDAATGVVLGIHCDDITVVSGRVVMVIDDLIDGGTTAIRVAEQLKNNGARQIILSCAHAVNLDGVKRVAGVYNYVFVTDSYYDWGSIELPNLKCFRI